MHVIDFSRSLIYTENARYLIKTTVVLNIEAVGLWKVASATHKDMETYTHGSFLIQPSSKTVLKYSTVHPVISHRTHRVTSMISRSDNKMFTTSSIYEVFFPRIVKYSKDYHVIQTLTIYTEGYATIQLPDTLNIQHNHFVFHPVLMDVILQVAGFIGSVYGTVGHAFICSKVTLTEVYAHVP